MLCALEDKAAGLCSVGEGDALADGAGEHWRVMIGERFSRLAGADEDRTLARLRGCGAT